MADKKGATPDDIMKPAGMKVLLRNSKNRTVYAAIGLTKDKDGVAMLDYLVKPKKLMAMLKDEAKKVKLELDTPSLRFGTALVDPDVDAELVKFTVNKTAPGVMEVKLRDLLKVVGYKQVQIGVDESLENEAEEGETQATTTQSVAPPPPPPPPPPQPEAGVGTPATPDTLAKSGQIWLAARKKVETELDKLRAQIVATYQADGIAADLEKRYQDRTRPVLEAWDESLANKLVAVASATDSTDRAKLIGEAKAIMTRYAKFLASEKLVGDLDNNPFVPLSLQKTIAGTLSMLSKAVH